LRERAGGETITPMTETADPGFDDDRCRCVWAHASPRMTAYHDREWGVPERDARALWEKLMLDGFQAGLSWSTVLDKREALRRAFEGFDPERVARYGERDVARLLADPGIIRSRAKIAATIAGARVFCQMRERGEDFSALCWSFTGGATLDGDPEHWVATTPLSEEISRAFKARGFRFVGPTIVYAWMQAVGIVNDHAEGCFRRAEVARLARAGGKAPPRKPTARASGFPVKP
jgi:DNA-3-methyladenine glycosylase I